MPARARALSLALLCTGCSFTAAELRTNLETHERSCRVISATLWQAATEVDWPAEDANSANASITIGVVAAPASPAPERAKCVKTNAIPPSESAWKVLLDIGAAIWGWVSDPGLADPAPSG